MQINRTRSRIIETLKTLGMIVIVLAVTAIILVVWAHLSMVIWHDFGLGTFVFWLLGSALALALTLVVVW